MYLADRKQLSHFCDCLKIADHARLCHAPSFPDTHRLYRTHPP